MSAYPVPFDQAGFPKIPDLVPPKKSDVSPKQTAQVTTESRSALRIPGTAAAIVKALWIQEVGGEQKSQSFQNEEPAKNAALDPSNHFHFLPTIDTVEIRWEVSHIDKVDTARFEIWSAADDSKAIWTKEYSGGGAIKLLKGTDGKGAGPLDWKEVVVDGDADRFPDKCPNVAYAPYQLRLTVICMGTGAVTTAWTYFDVLVDRIELHYGPEKLIPASAINDVHANPYWPLTQRDEKQLVRDLQAGGTAVPLSGLIPVALRSTQAAYVHFQEWYTWHDMSFLRHKARWGDGPRIPVVARIYLRGIDDKAQHSADAAKSLGPAKFLWDWHDKTETDRDNDIAGAHADTQAFIKKGLKYKEDQADEPPACLNCHADRGGKRGGAAKIFPAQASTASFPFLVDLGNTRKWASFSKARTDGEFACCTGVIFQPSRMALDSHKLYVALATIRKGDKKTPTLDDTGKIDALLANHPGLPSAHSGMFEVRRRIDARYVRKSAATTPMDLTLIDGMFEVGGIEIAWTKTFWSAANYRALFGQAGNSDESNVDAAYVRNKRHPQNRVTTKGPFTAGNRKADFAMYRQTRGDQPFAAFDHWSGDSAPSTNPVASEAQLALPARERVLARFVAQVVPTYIVKSRTYNDKKRKWAKIQTRYPTATQEEQYLRFYLEALTDTERAKLDAQIKAAYVGEKWAGWDVPEDYPRQWAADNYFYGYGFGAFFEELHQREVMADAFEGASFFHYTHQYETKRFDGTVEALQCDLGGLAAVGMSADLGFKGAFAVWDHPDNMQRQNLHHDKLRRSRTFKPADLTDPSALFMNGNYTAAHEFGHFMHLSHATPQATGAEAAVHDQNDVKCIMNYDHDGLHLCGGCALRVRGWAFFQDKGMLGFNNTSPDQPGAVPPPPDPKLSAPLAALYTGF